MRPTSTDHGGEPLTHVLLHYEPGPALRARLTALPGLRVTVLPVPERAAVAAVLPEIEVLWHVLEPVTAAMIAAAPKLRLIQKIGVGVNTIDLDAAAARGIAVCNMPGTNTVAVAEHTLALMLAALRRLAWLDSRMRAGAGWQLPDDYADRVGEIAGRRVGLIGMGAISRRLAPVLQAMGAEVIAWNRTPRADSPVPLLPLDEVIAQSDILSLHLPLTPETTAIIDRRRIGLMPPGAVLVNTARGGLVDQPALLDALADGRLSAAGLDAVAQEPIAPDDPLLANERVVLTPHIAWQTPETWERSLGIAIHNTVEVMRGGELRYRVV